MEVNITTSEKNIAVESPYDKDFIAKAKTLGGKWNPNHRVWVFDTRDEERVRELCMEVYGTDGSGPKANLHDIRIDLKEAGFWGDEKEIRVAGRRLCYRQRHDEAVRLSTNVILLKGKFKSSGGSRKYPNVGDVEGVILEVRDLSISVVNKIIEDCGEDAVTVLDDVDVVKGKAKDDFRKAVESAVEAGISRKELLALIQPEFKKFS